MHYIKYPFLFFFAFLFCSCATPVRKAAKAAAPVAAAVPVKTEPAVKLSTEAAKKVESLYYRAVGAYSANDMSGTLKYIDEISTLYPSYPPAVELRGKIKIVSGEKSAPLPQKP